MKTDHTYLKRNRQAAQIPEWSPSDKYCWYLYIFCNFFFVHLSDIQVACYQ